MNGVNERMWGVGWGPDRFASRRNSEPPTLSSMCSLTIRPPSTPPSVRPELVPPASFSLVDIPFQRSPLPRRSLSITIRQAACDRHDSLLLTVENLWCANKLWSSSRRRRIYLEPIRYMPKASRSDVWVPLLLARLHRFEEPE